MNLEEALVSGKPFETNFATNLERGWIALTVRPQGSTYHLEVAYDVENPLTLNGDASTIASFIQMEQGINPTDVVWIEMETTPDGFPLSAPETDWLADRREI